MTRPRWAPTIALARRVGHELGADCMILVRSETGQWGGASWGRTRERCASLGRVMDGLFDDGRLDGTVDDLPPVNGWQHAVAEPADPFLGDSGWSVCGLSLRGLSYHGTPALATCPDCRSVLADRAAAAALKRHVEGR